MWNKFSLLGKFPLDSTFIERWQLLVNFSAKNQQYICKSVLNIYNPSPPLSLPSPFPDPPAPAN